MSLFSFFKKKKEQPAPKKQYDYNVIPCTFERLIVRCQRQLSSAANEKEKALLPNEEDILALKKAYRAFPKEEEIPLPEQEPLFQIFLFIFDGLDHGELPRPFLQGFLKVMEYSSFLKEANWEKSNRIARFLFPYWEALVNEAVCIYYHLKDGDSPASTDDMAQEMCGHSEKDLLAKKAIVEEREKALQEAIRQ